VYPKNSFTHLRLIRRNNVAHFYALHCKGHVGSEGMNFARDHYLHNEFHYIWDIYWRLLRRGGGKSDLTYEKFFRPENKYIAIPSPDRNGGIVWGNKVGLRLFCFQPNNKTLVFLNGYDHAGITCDFRQHPNFKHKCQRMDDSINALERAEGSAIFLSPSGGYYKDKHFSELIENRNDFNLTDFLT
jgi:hypothetical protein